MIKGIGIDAVELPRIAKIIKEKQSFIDRVLTPNEIEQFQEIEILKNDVGQPVVTKSPHSGTCFVSITHTDELAFAQIILED